MNVFILSVDATYARNVDSLPQLNGYNIDLSVWAGDKQLIRYFKSTIFNLIQECVPAHYITRADKALDNNDLIECIRILNSAASDAYYTDSLRFSEDITSSKIYNHTNICPKYTYHKYGAYNTINTNTSGTYPLNYNYNYSYTKPSYTITITLNERKIHGAIFD